MHRVPPVATPRSEGDDLQHRIAVLEEENAALQGEIAQLRRQLAGHAVPWPVLLSHPVIALLVLAAIGVAGVVGAVLGTLAHYALVSGVALVVLLLLLWYGNVTARRRA